MIHDSILDTIGRTPVVRLHRIAPANVTLYAKVESFNPGGSVKDRLAIAIILDAEAARPAQARRHRRRGDLGQHRRGAGDGLRRARLQVRGGDDRNLLDRAPQADARLRRQGDPDRRPPSAAAAWCGARRNWREQHGWFLARQFENPANPAYHRQTTAAEILRDFAGRRLDHFVTGWGTGGTLTGVGEVLKVARPEVRITACEPAGASLLAGKEWQPHKIQGWTPDFVPEVLNRDVADADPADRRRARARHRAPAGAGGRHLRRHLRRRHRRRRAGSGEAAQDGDVILAMLPDTGERYLSTFLFEGVNEGSDDDWLAGL